MHAAPPRLDIRECHRPEHFSRPATLATPINPDTHEVLIQRLVGNGFGAAQRQGKARRGGCTRHHAAGCSVQAAHCTADCLPARCPVPRDEPLKRTLGIRVDARAAWQGEGTIVSHRFTSRLGVAAGRHSVFTLLNLYHRPHRGLARPPGLSVMTADRRVRPSKKGVSPTLWHGSYVLSRWTECRYGLVVRSSRIGSRN